MLYLLQYVCFYYCLIYNKYLVLNQEKMLQ